MPDATRIFFVHLMKTGGSGVSHLLRETLGEERCFPPTKGGVVLKIQPDAMFEQDPAYLARMRLVTVHMPAWVGEELDGPFIRTTVLREPVARTVSHLRHISRSVADGAQIEDLWADPEWRGRLSDYQVRFLGAPRPTPGTDPVPDWAGEVADASEAVQEEFRRALKPFFGTAVRTVEDVDESWLDRARDRLSNFEVVGTTENLAPYVGRLREVTGLAIPDSRVHNAATDDQRPSASLLDSIREATTLDRRLYESVAESP